MGWGALFLSEGGAPCGGIDFGGEGGGLKKIVRWGGTPHAPPLGNPALAT